MTHSEAIVRSGQPAQGSRVIFRRRDSEAMYGGVEEVLRSIVWGRNLKAIVGGGIQENCSEGRRHSGPLSGGGIELGVVF